MQVRNQKSSGMKDLAGPLAKFDWHQPIPEGVEQYVEGVPVTGTGLGFFYRRGFKPGSLIVLPSRPDKNPPSRVTTREPEQLPAPTFLFFAVPGSIRIVPGVEIQVDPAEERAKDVRDQETFRSILNHEQNVDNVDWMKYKLLRPNELALDLSLVDRTGHVYPEVRSPPYVRDPGRNAQEALQTALRQIRHNERFDNRELVEVLTGANSWRFAAFMNDRFLRGLPMVARVGGESGTGEECICRYRWEVRLEKRGPRYMRVSKEDDFGEMKEMLAEMRVNRAGQVEIVDPQKENLLQKDRSFTHYRQLEGEEGQLRYLGPYRPSSVRGEAQPRDTQGGPLKARRFPADESARAAQPQQAYQAPEGERDVIPSIETDTMRWVEQTEARPVGMSNVPHIRTSRSSESPRSPISHMKVININAASVPRRLRTWPGPGVAFDPAEVQENTTFRHQPGYSRAGARPRMPKRSEPLDIGPTDDGGGDPGQGEGSVYRSSPPKKRGKPQGGAPPPRKSTRRSAKKALDQVPSADDENEVIGEAGPAKNKRGRKRARTDDGGEEGLPRPRPAKRPKRGKQVGRKSPKTQKTTARTAGPDVEEADERGGMPSTLPVPRSQRYASKRGRTAGPKQAKLGVRGAEVVKRGAKAAARGGTTSGTKGRGRTSGKRGSKT
ncbi:MAG: hypothetical protein M1837_000467 [Sclerophora amabilis]|nr:MAG: hypothetical protein M1837_000467 [Sclerophora amabilis]